MPLSDAHADFATSLLTNTPGSSGTTFSVTAGTGTLFPAVPFDATVHDPAVVPTFATAEKVRVTARSTDDLTVTRTVGGTNKTVASGWRITAGIFADHIPKPQTASSVIASQVFG
jgi:hypothetical protein